MQEPNLLNNQLANHLPAIIAEPINAQLTHKLVLRPYQIETLAQVNKAFNEGKNRLLVSLPTGCGKTIIFAHLVTHALGRSLVIAHRDELIEQAADKIRMLFPSADIGIVKAERNQIDNQIIVASIQTLTRESRLSQLEKNFSTIIIDEAHHACSKSYKKVLDSLGSFNPDSNIAPLTLGVTATPERGDRVGLDKIFQEIVYHRNLLEMIEEQYLSDLTWQDIELNVDLDNIQTRAGDFIEAELIKALTNSDTPRQILYAFQQYASNRKTLIFVPGVTLARSIATLFKQNNIACESIDGKLSPKERKNILNRLHSGKTQVVVNCMILTEGFDEPSIDCIIFARPTKSKSFYLQMLGRGTRLHPNKKDCLIIDLVGLSKRHNLVTLPSLLGISKTKLKKKSLLSITSEIEESKKVQIRSLDLLAEQKKALVESQKQEKSDTTIALKQATSDSDLLDKEQRKKKSKKVLRFNWLKLSEKCYALSIGDDGVVFLISENKQDWTVIWRESSKTNLLARELSLEYSMGIAQDFVRGLGVSALVDFDANWRKEQASEKQFALLESTNTSYPLNITKGLASDLIAIHFGKQELNNYQKTISNSDNSKTTHQFSTIQLIDNIDNEANKALAYKPRFTKNCYPPLPNNFIKYEDFKLNNYKPLGSIYSKTNRSQSLALITCKEYLDNYFHQEVGIIFSGEKGVGKTHLSIAILSELTNKYGIATLFCDYELLLKQIQETNYNDVLNKLLGKISESQVILLDGFTAKHNKSVPIKNLMSCIISSCCNNTYYDKKLILTTRHHSYSSTYSEVESFRLSLGDILGLDSVSKLYDYCHYLEIDSVEIDSIDDKDQPSNRIKTMSNFISLFEITDNIFDEISKNTISTLT